MMRIVIFIALASVTNAKDCAIDSSGAVANAIDSALGIWASTERCKPPITSPVKCEKDVAGTIKAVSATANAIGAILASCGAIDESNQKCGWAVNALLGASAGLAQAGAEIADMCFLHEAGPEELHPVLTDLGKCTANGGGAINSIFEAKNTISHMQKSCDSSGSKCTADVLDVVSVVSELGAHIAGSTAFCEFMKVGAKGVEQSKCAKGVMEAVSSLADVSKLSMGIEKECSASATRLYLEKHGESATSSAMLPITLAAALPLAAVLSVIAGMRLGKSRQHSSARMIPAQDAEELLEAPALD